MAVGGGTVTPVKEKCIREIIFTASICVEQLVVSCGPRRKEKLAEQKRHYRVAGQVLLTTATASLCTGESCRLSKSLPHKHGGDDC